MILLFNAFAVEAGNYWHWWWLVLRSKILIHSFLLLLLLLLLLPPRPNSSPHTPTHHHNWSSSSSHNGRKRKDGLVSIRQKADFYCKLRPRVRLVPGGINIFFSFSCRISSYSFFLPTPPRTVKQSIQQPTVRNISLQHLLLFTTSTATIITNMTCMLFWLVIAHDVTTAQLTAVAFCCNFSCNKLDWKRLILGTFYFLSHYHYTM